MKRNCQIGLKRSIGFDAGRGLRAMPADELQKTGRARVSPARALRLKCLGVDKTFALTVRLCTAVDCPSWPFRMGKNPWRPPLSAEVRTQRAATMARNRASALSNPDKTQAQIGASGFQGGGVPEGAFAEFSSTGNSDDAGGAS